jgi:hypothetical protein
MFAGGEFHGHVDYGDGNVSSEEATHALVIMAVSINSSWKLPIAHFFTSSITSEVQANLLTLATSYLNDTGAIITNMTCDNAASNLATIRLLGGNVSNHMNLKASLDLVNVLDIPIMVILDPCHILKLVRGTLHDCQVIYSSETSAPAKWQHISSLQELQSNEGLHLGMHFGFLCKVKIQFFVFYACTFMWRNYDCILCLIKNIGTDAYKGLVWFLSYFWFTCNRLLMSKLKLKKVL